MLIKVVRKDMRTRRAASVSFNAGLSLIEMMFASGIVALTLSMVFGALVSLSDVSQSAERRAIAVTHLATVLETLQSLPYEDLRRYDPSALEGLAKGETVVAECFDASGAVVPLPLPPGAVQEALPNPLRVRATITWTVGRGRILSMSGWVLLARS